MELDRRYNPLRTFPAVETEALSQQEIQRVLRETLNDALPQPLAEIRERQQLQRDAVREALRSGGLL